jgi:hypothetical protein
MSGAIPPFPTCLLVMHRANVTSTFRITMFKQHISLTLIIQKKKYLKCSWSYEAATVS